MIDLTARNFTIPSYSLTAGQLFDVEYEFFNQSNENIDTFDVEFYISTDNVITNEDILLGSQTITGVESNSTTDLLANSFNLAPDNPFLSNGNGIYYIGTIFDPNNSTQTSTAEVKVTTVTPSYFSLIPNPVNAGDQIKLAFSLDNVANLIAENVEVEFYLSTNDWISTDDYKLGSFTLDSIAPDSNSGINVLNFDLPSDLNDFWRFKEDGFYSVGVIVPGDNPTNPIDNFFSGNNSQFVDYDKIEVGVSNFVDLTGESFNAVIEEFDTAKIDFSVFNLGDGAADRFTVDFYISHNDYISENDFYLGSHEVNNLPAEDSTGNITTSFELPDTRNDFWDFQSTDTYSIGMIINPSEAVNETLKFSNNANQQEFFDSQVVEVENPEWVDLKGFNFNVKQESIFDSFNPGQTIDVEYGIDNAEVNLVEQDFDVSFYISTDPIIDRTDTFLGKTRVEEDTDLVGSTQLILPGEDAELWTVDTERLFVGMVVDSENEIIEIDEENNSNQGELVDYDGTGGFLDEFKEPLPDLVMESFRINSDMEEIENGNIDLEFAIANINQATSTPFSIEFYISDNNYISTDDFKIGSYNVAGDFAASTGTVNQSLEIPDITSGLWNTKGNGTYHVGAIIDVNQEVQEFKKSNNANFGYSFDRDIFQVKNSSGIENRVDLIGKQFSVAENKFFIPNEFLNIDFEILNQGTKDAGSFSVEFYLSQNEYISENDFKLGSLDIDSLVGAETTGLLTRNYQLPDEDNEIWGNNGTYYVGMLIDSDNEVEEITQLNNNNQGLSIDSDSLSFVRDRERVGKDMFGVGFDVVEEGTENKPLISGQEVNIEYEIYNRSFIDIDFFAAGFYLFTEDYFNSHDQISYDDVLDNNSDIHFLFGDRISTLLEDVGSNQTTGKVNTKVEIPDDWDKLDELGDGYYYIGMLSDQWEEVAEFDEVNNSLMGELIDYEKVYIDVI